MNDVGRVLEEYPFASERRVAPLCNAGGMSGAQFWRIHTVVDSLLLRRWPKEHPTAERLQCIHAVLELAAERGITFLPTPLRTRDGATFVEHAGHLWELAPWMPGTAAYEQAPSLARLCAATVALAQFHLATTAFLSIRQKAEFLPVSSPPAPQRHLARLWALAHGGTDELGRAVTNATWPELAPLARQFLTTLPAALPRAIAELEPLAHARLPVQPCIRDIWHDHILFTGDELTGIIDFGALDFDTPATDIARLLGSLAETPLPYSEGTREGSTSTWHHGLAAYASVRPLSADETRAALALDASGTILAGCNWIRWIYIDGRRFEDPQQVLKRFRRILARVRIQLR